MLNKCTVMLSVVLFVLLFGLCFFLKVYDITARVDDDLNSLITLPNIVTVPAETHIKRIDFFCIVYYV